MGLCDCVTFDEVAGIDFKDKDGIQIMKDYMASGSFAHGKEELESWLCRHWLHYARLLLANRFLAALWYLEKSVSAVR